MSQFIFNSSPAVGNQTEVFGSASSRNPLIVFGSQRTPNSHINPFTTFGNTNIVASEEIQENVVIGNQEKIQIISHENLLTLASEFYKNAEYREDDIVDTLKSMICSAKFLFSDKFKTNKLDLNDIQLKFRMLTQPESFSRDEIIALLFRTHNTIQQ